MTGKGSEPPVCLLPSLLARFGALPMSSRWEKGLSAFETACTGFLPFPPPPEFFPQNEKYFVVYIFNLALPYIH